MAAATSPGDERPRRRRAIRPHCGPIQPRSRAHPIEPARRYPPAVPEKKKVRRPGGSIQARPVTARGGRVTPKGGGPEQSGRYTAPIPHEYKVSPRWVPIAMAILLIGGMLMIVTNYLNLLPGPDPSNAYLLGGLGLITVGFVVATRWR